ncbi:MAG: hypothetical protein LBI49_18590 [Nocardiopsaceae bacterium]|nr:hypothetical protein [Nocardiopsaceae bacterium]
MVFGALLAELVAGLVTNRMPMAIAAPALVVPVVVAAGFAVVQWWQVRSSKGDPVSWWHLGGVAGALFTWIVYPTVPDRLAQAGNAKQACFVLHGSATPDCLHRATQAMTSHALVWWLTGAVILGAALLTRRSRIAPWAAIPAALGGCLLAYHFLELLVLYYQPGG